MWEEYLNTCRNSKVRNVATQIETLLKNPVGENNLQGEILLQVEEQILALYTPDLDRVV